MLYHGTVILPHGSPISLKDWQYMCGLDIGSPQIADHFRIGEMNRHRKSVIRNGFTISSLILDLLDEIREHWGITFINSFDRTDEEQDKLNDDPNIQAAASSPHVVKLAVDIDTLNESDTYKLVELIENRAKALNIKIRLGYRKYLAKGQTFVHLDVCPMYYAPGMPWHGKEHPEVWEVEARW